MWVFLPITNQIIPKQNVCNIKHSKVIIYEYYRILYNVNSAIYREN